MTLEFKPGEGAITSQATGIRGDWHVCPWEDRKHGERFTLLLYRPGEWKPRPFGHFFTPDEAETAAERYDERGN